MFNKGLKRWALFGCVFATVMVLCPGSSSGQTPAAPPPQPKLGPDFRTACWKGDLATVTTLLDQGAPLEGRDSYGRTPLFLACHGCPDVVKFLLSRGAKVDVVAKNGDTTMGRACEYGDLASAKMLLAAGADLNRANQWGHTPLMLAAREGHEDLVSFLIEQHVDLNVAGESSSALFFAVWKDHRSIAKRLIDAGADLKAKINRPADPMHPVKTLLSCATDTNDLEMIDLLLSQGADINEASENGYTPLIETVGVGEPSTIQHLLEKGADPNSADMDGATPLMIATDCQPTFVMQMLLQRGAKLDATDKQGRTALVYACRSAYAPAAKYLIDQGAKIDISDIHGETPVTYAGNRGRLGLVQFLIDKGAKPQKLHIIDQEKPTPPLSPAQTWALGVGAIFTQYNGNSHQMLGGGDDTGRMERSLREEWGITDKASLLKEVDELCDRSKPASYPSQAVTWISLIGFEMRRLLFWAFGQSDDPNESRSSYVKWREKSGLAYDLCRAANLINAGFSAGYINEKEAWIRLMAIARQTQGSFSSWQEMNENFIDGRELWTSEHDKAFKACAKLLLDPTEPNSPWNQNPWDTDLGAARQGEEKFP